MVAPCSCRVLVATLVAAQAALLPAEEPPVYRVGDTAQADIVTPFHLTVVDAKATAVLKRREAERVPVHLRYYLQVADEADAALRAAFAATRSNFIQTVVAAFGRPKLAAEDLASTRFHRLYFSFQMRNADFPVSTNLAALWASGESDQHYLDTVAARLHQTLNRPVRSPQPLPDDIKIGSTARLIPLSDTNESTSAQLAEKLGRNIAKTNLTSFQRARSELLDAFPPDERELARYVASFVQPNCILDADLTRQLWARRTDGMVAVEQYAAGEVIARRGQTIDEKTLAAIEELREKSAVLQLEQAVVQKNRQKAVFARWTPWAIGLAAAALLGALMVAGRFRRRKRALLPPSPAFWQLTDGEVPVVPDMLVPGSSGQWQQRALAAEQKANAAREMVRTGLLAHLANLFSGKFVQHLMSQRARLLQSQEQAAAGIEQLGERLDTLHTRLQDRLVAYEQRITELEQQLDDKSLENRELIKAELQSIRRQLEIERARSQSGLN